MDISYVGRAFVILAGAYICFQLIRMNLKSFWFPRGKAHLFFISIFFFFPSWLYINLMNFYFQFSKISFFSEVSLIILLSLMALSFVFAFIKSLYLDDYFRAIEKIQKFAIDKEIPLFFDSEDEDCPLAHKIEVGDIQLGIYAPQIFVKKYKIALGSIKDDNLKFHELDEVEKLLSLLP